MAAAAAAQVCLDDLAASRRQSLSKRFTAALTRGGPGGVPKPIEMQAPGPARPGPARNCFAPERGWGRDCVCACVGACVCVRA